MRKLWSIIVVGALLLAVTPVLAVTLSGTNASDNIEGTPTGDLINAGNGEDIVHGRGGNDVVNGENGNDRLFGDDGRDHVNGANGDDELTGGDDEDHLAGGNGNDQLLGEAGDDSAVGGNGDDVFDGGAGHDTFSGEAGNDRAAGGAGLDALYASTGDEQLDGGADNDLISSLVTTGNHTLTGGPGNDLISGTGFLRGGDGNDVLISTGTIGNVDGGAGTDTCIKPTSVQATGCETILILGSSTATPTLAMTNGPAEGATVAAGSVTVNFTTTNSGRAWCIADTGAVVNCASGTFTANGLSNGDHAIAIIAAPNGAKPSAVLVRHFTVAAAVSPSIATFSSPAADTLEIVGSNLENLDALRAYTADGQQLTYTLPDSRVTFAASTNTYAITDVNIGRETITRVDAIDNGQVVATKTGSVAVASSITLADASSNAPSTLVIDGTHLTAADRISLVHSTGTLSIALTDLGVVVSNSQIIITSTALDGIHVSEISAVRVMDGVEVMATLAVDITIAQSDTTPPAISVPANITTEGTAPNGASATFVVTAQDAVSGTVAVTCDHASGSTFALGDTTVACSAEDAAGNEAQASFTITVADTTGPAISVPAQVIVDADDANGKVVEFEAEASDLIDGARPVTCVPASGSLFAIGTTNVVCESFDTRDNTSATSFTVTISDVTPPVLTLPSNLVVEATSGAGADVAFEASAVDNVDGSTDVACNRQSGSVFGLGETQVSCSANDISGNSANGSFLVRVQDTTSPTLHLPTSVEASATGTSGAAVEFEATATDLVDGNVTVLCSPPSGAVFPVGASTVSCVAADARGNTSSGSFEVLVDNQAPVLTYDGPTDFYVSAPTGGPVFYDVTAQDTAGDEVEAVCAPASGSVQPVGALDVHCTAQDGAGNEGSLDLHLVVHYREPFASAEDTITESLPQVWEQRHKLNLPMSTVVSRTSPTQMVLRVEDGEGGTQPAVAHGLFGYEKPDGTIAAIDTALAARSAGGWAPAAVGYDAVLPDAYADGVAMGLASQVGGGTIRFTPRGTRSDAPEGRVVQSGDHLLYPAAWTETDVVTTALGDRIAEHLIVKSEHAPRSYSWVVDHPAGTTLLITNDGDLEVEAGDGSRQLLVPRATAYDAAGQMIAAGYELATVNGADVLTLHWGDLPDAPDGPDAEIAYPIAIDPPVLGPYQYVINNFASNMATVSNDAGGVYSRCDAAILDLQFVGRQWHEGSATYLRKVDPGSEANCTIGGPRAGESWYFFGGSSLHWGLNNQQLVTLTDQTGAAPVFSGYGLGHFARDGGIAASDTINDLTWWSPTGSLVFRMSQVQSEILGLQGCALPPYGVTTSGYTIPNDACPEQVRTAQIYNPTAVYIDTLPPQVTFSPETWPARISPIDRVLSLAVAQGDGSGCAGGSINLSRVSAPVQSLQDVPFTGCGATTTLPAGYSPGTYSLSFSTSDAAGNVTARSTQFTIVAPIDSPAEGATISGTSTIQTELTNELSAEHPGALAVLTATDASGQSTILANQSVVGWLGLRATNWNTFSTANGAYTLTLALSDGTRLATKHVIVHNDPLMGRHDDLSSDSIPGGLTVTHVNGNLTLHNEDVNINGLGVDLLMNRTYNSQLGGTGTLGRAGWRAGFEQRLVLGTNGYVRYVDPTGMQFEYTPNAGGTFERAPGLESDLTRNPNGSFALRANDGVTQTFDTQGRWTGTVTPNGNHVNVARDAFGRVSQLSDDSGLALTLAYDAAGRLSTVEDPAHHLVRYIYDTAGDLVAYRDETGAEWTYHYSAANNLDAVKSPASTTSATVTYNQDGIDASGNPTDGTVGALIDAVSNTTYIDYDFDASTVRVARVPLAGSPATAPAYTHTINDAGRKTFTITPEPSSETITYVWDAQLRLVYEEESDPKRTTYTYDALGNVLTETVIDTAPPAPVDPTRLGALVTTHTGYNLFGEASSTTDPKGNTSLFTYDTRGNLLTDEAPAGGVTHYTYDDAGQLESMTDPEDRVTEYSYNPHGWLTTTSNPDETETNTTYDANGNVLTETNENGDTTTIVRDAAGRPLVTTDASGLAITSTYDGEGNELTSTNDRGGVTRYTYSNNGQLVTSRDALNRAKTYTYDTYGNQASYTNENGRTWQSIYDAHGSLRSETDPVGNTTLYDYDGEGRRISMTLPGNAVTRYTYDHASNLLSATDSDGVATRYEYYPDGSIKREVSGEGDATAYAYDPNSNEQMRTNPDGTSEASDYDSADQLIEYIDSGIRESYEYDLRGRRKGVETPAGTTTTGFDSAGREISTTNANNHITEFGFDEVGRLTSQTNPDSEAISLTYDDAGETIGAVDARGKATSLVRDLSGRVTRANHPDGTFNTYQYDAAGNLTRSQVNTSPTFTQYTYDNANRMLTARTEEGDSYTFTYDGRGNVASQVKNFTHTTTYTYTGANRLKTLTNSGRTSTFTYDDAGRLERRVTPVGTTDYTYLNGRLARIDDSVAGITAYTYDAQGRVASQAGASGNVDYTYDTAGRVHSITQGDGERTTYGYDEVGNVTDIGRARLTPSGWLSLGADSITYDENERPESVTNPDGELNYEYNPADGVTAANLYGKEYEYEHDSRGRMSSQTTPDGSTSHYEYTAKGYLSKVTHGNGDVTTYEYDNNERTRAVTSDSGYRRSFSYYSSGDLGSATTPGKPTKDYSFYSFANGDNSGALLNFYSDNQNFIDQHYYQYGGVYQAQLFVRPRTTATVNQIPLAFRQLVLSCMDADACSDPDVAAAMRKFQVIDPDYDISTYTDIENRVAQVLWLFAPQRYVNTMAPTTGRLTSVDDREEGTTSTFSYDDSGNQITNLVRDTATGQREAYYTSAFDDRDRMRVHVADLDGSAPVQHNYTYDDQGRLIRIIGGGEVKTLRYDLDGRLVQENSTAGDTEISYAYNPLGLESMTVTEGSADPETYYYEFNTHGDVVHLVDSDGELAATYHYDAWGQQRTSGDEDLIAINRFAWAGRSGAILVRPMNMYYMGIRWYDPAQQRFVSEDPLPADPSKNANTYAYGNNNPVSYLDATGLTATPVRTLNHTRPAPIATPTPVMPRIPTPTVIDDVPREPVAPTPTLEPEEVPDTADATRKYKYDGAKAAAHAEKWAAPEGKHDPAYSWYPEGDCANFLSQNLAAGGMTADAKWYKDSPAWVNAEKLRDYLITSGRVYRRPSTKEGRRSLRPGDAIFVDHGNYQAGADHSVTVYGRTSYGNPRVASHTGNYLMNWGLWNERMIKTANEWGRKAPTYYFYKVKATHE